MADSRTPPSLLSTAGALQARIPPPANVTRNKTAIESRDRLMIVLDVKPPAFDGREFAVARTFCGRDPSSRAVLTAIERRLMMPGIDPPGKRFSAALRVSDRGLTPRRCREMPVAQTSVAQTSVCGVPLNGPDCRQSPRSNENLQTEVCATGLG